MTDPDPLSDAHAPDNVDPPAVPGRESGGRVLIADHDADARDHLRRLLATHHEVVTAADGDAALAAALAEPPDLIVSDLMMSGRDGLALLSALRADPATTSVPVLLLSARAGEDAAVQALAGGADDYLVKPFTALELLARVDAHLRLNRARRETERVKQRYLAARDVVLALQGSLLPESLPVLPGVRLAAHYLVAGSEQAAGGDWFDAVPLPDGRVALIAGDVVGHGARASAAMGQLRAVLTECLLEGHGVTDSLARLDRFVARVPYAAATTVCLAILDPDTGRVAYACSGHPPPLLVTAGGRANYLPANQGSPLGTAGGPPAEQVAWLKSGDVILLYTDGLVERPGRRLPAGLDELRAHAAQALFQGAGRASNAAAVERVCRLTMERMTSDGYDDDVSLIAAQLISPIPAPFEARLDAVPEILAGLRRDLGAWLGETGASDEDVWRVQLAVGEAVTNAIDHAYPGGTGRVLVEGYHDPDGRACFTVSDSGEWRAPPAEPDARGRGLIMIRACMDTVEVERSPHGTTVLMDRLLGRKPVFASAEEGPGAAPTTVRRPLRMELERAARPRLTVTGSIDAGTIDEFRRRLQIASRGGTLPLELDLAGVEVLASAGVQALHELAEQMAADHLAARLIAPPGCPARYVLQLTGLDHLLAPEPPVWEVPRQSGIADARTF